MLKSIRPLDVPEHGKWVHLKRRSTNPALESIVMRAFIRTLNLQRLGISAGRHGNYGSSAPTIRIDDTNDFAARLLWEGQLGFGEGFIRRTWHAGDSGGDLWAETNELVDWLLVYAETLNETGADRPRARDPLRRPWLPRSPNNDRESAQRNVGHHYDLPNEFFELFLDETLSYSSGDWRKARSLETSQMAKHDGMNAIVDAGATARLLDIGCGWGAYLRHAAKTCGGELHGVTLAARQAAYCGQWVANEGLEDRVHVKHLDYRDVSGTFDAVVSIEMLEAVGAKYWDTFFNKVSRVLRPEGVFGVQFITFPHDRAKAALGDFSWVDRYIFPGGELPSVEMVHRSLGRSSDLEIEGMTRLSESYAETLREWRRRFCENEPAVLGLGFDANFVRLWALYLAYFEAGFRARHLDVWQAKAVNRRARRPQIRRLGPHRAAVSIK